MAGPGRGSRKAAVTYKKLVFLEYSRASNITYRKLYYAKILGWVVLLTNVYSRTILFSTTDTSQTTNMYKSIFCTGGRANDHHHPWSTRALINSPLSRSIASRVRTLFFCVTYIRECNAGRLRSLFKQRNLRADMYLRFIHNLAGEQQWLRLMFLYSQHHDTELVWKSRVTLKFGKRWGLAGGLRKGYGWGQSMPRPSDSRRVSFWTWRLQLEIDIDDLLANCWNQFTRNLMMSISDGGTWRRKGYSIYRGERILSLTRPIMPP